MLKPFRHISLLALFLLCTVAAWGQKQAVPTTYTTPSDVLFPLDSVRLLPSRFADNMRRDSAWMMSIPVSSLLHSFQTVSGAFAGKEGGYMTVRKLGGWESMDCDLRGHITGHLLSALATLYAQTHSDAVKAKADSIVNGLNAVQQAYGRGGYLSAFGEGLIDRNIEGKSVWAPWYTLHKIAQGLIDQYTLCHNDTALAVVGRMTKWAYNKLRPLNDTIRRRMLRNEFGGFNDAMYQLYALTGNEQALWLAHFFYHNDKVDPLKAGNTDLGTNHANTFIPKLIGEARQYELFGDTLSRKAAEALFTTLAYRHAFVTGEVSDHEHLFKPEEQHKHLSGYDGENCCTFNLLKLAEHVYGWNLSDTKQRERITGYYERALYNHILGQQDPQSSMVCYFTPLLTGAYRLYSTRDSSYWCCVGSGFESHVRYASMIYGRQGNSDLFVNLLIPSTLSWQGTTLTQRTDFPRSGHVEYVIGGRSRTFALHLRQPQWSTAMTVTVNGRKAKATIRRHWRAGDRVTVDYGMALHEESLRGDSTRFAVLYGPVVLAGQLGAVAYPFSDPKKYNDYYTFDFHVPADCVRRSILPSARALRRISPLHYKTPSGIALHPFYDAHHERYVVYWKRGGSTAVNKGEQNNTQTK